MAADLRLALVLTVLQVFCFQIAAIPGVVRIVRRQRSADLSMWREILLLVGVGFQVGAFFVAAAAWPLYLSPVTTAIGASALLWVIRKYRC